MTLLGTNSLNIHVINTAGQAVRIFQPYSVEGGNERRTAEMFEYGQLDRADERRTAEMFEYGQLDRAAKTPEYGQL